jgi:hypothetical protein
LPTLQGIILVTVATGAIELVLRSGGYIKAYLLSLFTNCAAPSADFFLGNHKVPLPLVFLSLFLLFCLSFRLLFLDFCLDGQNSR